jgi:hypothetical protein
MSEKITGNILYLHCHVCTLLGILTLAVILASCGLSTAAHANLPLPPKVVLPNDYQIISTPPYPDKAYSVKSLEKFVKETSPDGAIGVNSQWEHGQASNWYIEEQRTLILGVVGGILQQNTDAIKVGFRVANWGFAHQAEDGSFAGTGDAFHSTSFFVESVAHSLLLLEASGYASQYQQEIQTMTPKVHKAALWMIQPQVWKNGIAKDMPYTHRRYLVAAAVGLTGKLTNDENLIEKSREMIKDGLSLQTAEGYNPEKGGHDTSYHMVGLYFAQGWLTYFPTDPLAPRVVAMIEKGLDWAQTRILPDGTLNITGDTRTAGQEKMRNGKPKTPAFSTIIKVLIYWGIATHNQHLIDLGLKVNGKTYKQK